jgi:hypothetical protein
LKNPFAKRSATDRRTETAAKLAEAETQAETAKVERLRLALAGEDTGSAEEAAWKAEARIRTLREAVAALDREIAAEEVRKADAERAARRADATATVEAWRSELVTVQAKLPLLHTATDLTAVQDRCGHGVVIDLIGHRMEGYTIAVEELVMQSLGGFANMLRILEQGNGVADELASKVLSVHATIDNKVRRAA